MSKPTDKKHASGASFMEREFRLDDSKLYEPDYFEPNSVFVIMPFTGEGMAEVYSVIKDECTRLWLKATRVDESVGSGFIIKEIIDLIKKAEFIICDLTHERPNVYYELGYAHGVGNQPLNILLIAKDETNIHFDIAPLRVKYYSSTEHLRSVVASSLKSMILATRKQSI